MTSRFRIPADLDSDDDEAIPSTSHFKPGRILSHSKITAQNKGEDGANQNVSKSSSQETSTIAHSRDANKNSDSISAFPSEIPRPTPEAGGPTNCPTTSKPAKAVPSNSIIVNPKQRGNPILKHLTNVVWEYGDIVPDYQVGLTSCVLFLSLRYHNLNPDYIQSRLESLGNMYELRILLVQVDVKDPHPSLKELALMGILANFTLMVAWSPEEAGRYLETYKIYENKPPDALKSRPETDFHSQVADALTIVKGVNKTDAATLLATFDSMASLVGASEEKLLLCPGLGPQKAQRLRQLFDTPFTKWK